MVSLTTQFVEFCMQQGVLTFGDFTLKSGRISPYFFNFGRFDSGFSLKRLGEFYAQAMIDQALPFDQLFGPAYKGIPLVCSIAIALKHVHGKDIPYSFNRKEAKDHGEGGQIVGSALAGNILIVDDVITQGTAFQEAMALFKANNVTPAGLIIALDRQEVGPNGQAAIEEIRQQYGIPIVSLIDFSDIMRYVANTQLDARIYDKMVAYQARYGVALK